MATKNLRETDPRFQKDTLTYRLFDGAERRWALPPQTDVTISQVVGKQKIVCIYSLILD